MHSSLVTLLSCDHDPYQRGASLCRVWVWGAGLVAEWTLGGLVPMGSYQPRCRAGEGLWV